MNKLTLVPLVFVLANCASVPIKENSTRVSVNDSLFAQKKQSEYGCVGVARSPYRDHVIREEDAQLKARENYVRNCMNAEDRAALANGGTLVGVETWYHPGENVAVAWCGPSIKCKVIKE